MTELRLAVRSLRRQPAMSTLAVVALALGIGLTTTMFSIVNGVILRGLPFPDSGRIAHVAPFSLAEQDDRPASVHTFADLRDRQQSFEQLAAFEVQIANVVGPDGVPARYSAAAVTANMFRLLRASPVAGRDFRDEASACFAGPAPAEDRSHRQACLPAGRPCQGGTIACFVPARRAARVDPMVALRYE